MTTIEVHSEELDLIESMLSYQFEDIRSEIHHSRNHEFREALKRKEAVIRGLQLKVGVIRGQKPAIE